MSVETTQSSYGASAVASFPLAATPPARAMSDRRSSVRSDIQALRASAVILVVLYHAHLLGLPGGFIGVDVFFVISGYLLIPAIRNGLAEVGGRSIGRFYARRMRRLLPAFTAMILVTLALIAALEPPPSIMSYATLAFASVLYSANFYLMAFDDPYFGVPSLTHPFTHTWSLSVEEQFYFVFPLLLWLGYRIARGKGLAIVLAAVTLVSFLFCWRLTAVQTDTAFFSPFTRAWEFGLGGAAAFLPIPQVSWQRTVLAAGGLIAILAGAVFISANSPFPGVLALMPTLGTAAALAAGGIQESRLFWWFRTSPVLLVGDMSYSLYLWHWPILALAAFIFPAMPLEVRFACVFLALVVAFASYAVIENPPRNSPALARWPSWRILVLGACLMLVGAAAAVGAFMFGQARASQSALIEHLQQAREPPPFEHLRACTPGPLSSDVPACDFGAVTSDRRVVLFGDSHARQWVKAVSDWAKGADYKLTVVIKPGCSPVAMRELDARAFRLPEEACVRWRRAAVAKIEAMRPAQLLMVSSRQYVAAAGRSGPGLISTSEWRGDVVDTLRTFAHAGVGVLFLRQTPILPEDPIDCVGRFAALVSLPTGGCEESAIKALPGTIDAVDRQAVASVPQATLVDFAGSLCARGSCPLTIGDLIVFSDGSHLSQSYIARITPEVADVLNQTIVRRPASLTPSPPEASQSRARATGTTTTRS
jgi:peptidoglycan/LPS O-acetylase OafA/YrhL